MLDHTNQFTISNYLIYLSRTHTNQLTDIFIQRERDVEKEKAGVTYVCQQLVDWLLLYYC